MQSDIDLVEYWLEQLEPAERIAIEARLAQSDSARERALQVQTLLAHVGSLSSPLKPTPSVVDRLMESLDDTTRFDGFISRLTTFLDLPATRVRELLATARRAAPNTPGWQTSGLKGLLAYPFRGGANIAAANTQMLHMAAGFVFPNHRHIGSEWGFVAQGTLIEHDGRCVCAGDIVHKTPGSRHSFRVDGSQPAIVFIVLEGPIEWLGNPNDG